MHVTCIPCSSGPQSPNLKLCTHMIKYWQASPSFNFEINLKSML